jgi:hypothetical protein
MGNCCKIKEPAGKDEGDKDPRQEREPESEESEEEYEPLHSTRSVDWSKTPLLGRLFSGSMSSKSDESLRPTADRRRLTSSSATQHRPLLRPNPNKYYTTGMGRRQRRGRELKPPNTYTINE